MADRGITFSAAMVRAMLEGRKTQTRRLVPDQTCWRDDGTVWTGFMGWQDRAWAFENRGAVGRGVLPPHAPGDRLYVREHWKVAEGNDGIAPRDMPPATTIHYLADGAQIGPSRIFSPLGRQRQAMHMPRWASRLTLLVTDVRVQRLQDISDADAAAEGVCTALEADQVARGKGAFGDISAEDRLAIVRCHFGDLRTAYHWLWESLHTEPGTRWEDNPWIYAVSFDVRHGNIDQIGAV